MTQRTMSVRIHPNHPDYGLLKEQASSARKLYNGLIAVSREAHAHARTPHADLFIAKDLKLQEWVQNNPFLGSNLAFEKIRKIIQTHYGLSLPEKVAQHVARSAGLAWKSYYALRKTNPRAKPPRFVRDYYVCHYTIQALSKPRLRQDIVQPTGWTKGVKIPKGLNVQSARLVRKNGDFYLEIVHKVGNNLPQRTEGITAAIDLGVDVLAAITFSDGRQPLLVNGKPLKSMNAFANKRAAQHKSVLDIERNRIEAKLKRTQPDIEKLYPIKSKKLDRLWGKRNRKINHYLHAVSREMTREFLRTGVKNVIIGWSPGFKQAPRMGRKTNQKFVTIPHARFVETLAYKLAEHGITLERVEESYTSKASFLDIDPIPIYPQTIKPQFSGSRIKRGLYKTSTGELIHADINASYNILAKHATSSLPATRTGCVVQPRFLRLREGTKNKVVA